MPENSLTLTSGRKYKKMWLPLALLTSLLVIGVQKIDCVKEPKGNLNKMVMMRERHGSIIPMDGEQFKKYVKSPKDGYSVVAMFTATGASVQCDVCPEARKEFSVLVSSYEALYGSPNKLFFVLIDFQNARDAFQQMKLQYVPAFYYFPGHRKRKKSDTFDSRRAGYKAVALAQWIAEVADTKIKIVVPVDFKPFLTAAAALFPFFLLALWKPDLVTKVMGNKFVWGLLVMGAVLVMTSGQMWNHIRKPADASRNSKGGVQYIHGGRSAQYVLESYMIMGINAAIAVGFIFLNEVHRFENKYFRKGLGFIGLAMVGIFFGLLISIFRMKVGGYPYSFLFL